MGIGIVELFVILIMIAIPALIVLAIVFAVRRSGSTASRLSRLERLRAEGKITATEYERQRAVIVSGV